MPFNVWYTGKRMTFVRLFHPSMQRVPLKRLWPGNGKIKIRSRLKAELHAGPGDIFYQSHSKPGTQMTTHSHDGDGNDSKDSGIDPFPRGGKTPPTWTKWIFHGREICSVHPRKFSFRVNQGYGELRYHVSMNAMKPGNPNEYRIILPVANIDIQRSIL